MNHRPIRIPRWILAGMPVVWAALWLGHTAGSAALLLWLLTGFLQKQPQYPYPRKSRRSIARLFFAFSGGAFVIFCFSGRASSALSYPGTACIAVVTASLLWQWQLPNRWRLPISFVLLFIACM
ncbi:MAG: hypothetical protein IJO67_07980 [Clostridia bacterium]|nr:hypothetical protein [Clostridia bacterium]